MIYKSKWIASSFALAVAMSGVTAHAQDTTSPTEANEREYDEIVVTANKRQQSINDVGLSITAESGDSLITRGVMSPQDLGRVIPGLTVQPSPFNTPVYTLRGVGFYESTLSASPTVAVYQDEIALPFSATTKGATLDLERVEVLKGPQGTLFGNNTTGGAINYVAAKPTDEFAAGANASFERFSMYTLSGYVSGPLSDTLKARIALRTVQGGAWQRSNTSIRRLGDANQFQGRFLLDWQPTPELKVSLNLNGWTDNGDTQAPQFLVDSCGGNLTGACGAPEAVYFSNYPRPPRSNRVADWGDGVNGRGYNRDDRFGQAALRIDYDLSSALTLTSISAYSDYKTDALNEFDGTPQRGVDYSSEGYIRDFSQEVRLSARLSNLNLIVGGNYNRSNTFDQLGSNFQDSPACNPLYAIPGAPRCGFSFDWTKQKVKTIAAFANAEFTFLDNFTLIGGVRYTDTKRNFAGCTFAGDDQTAIWWNAIFGTSLVNGDCITFTPNFPETFDPFLVDQLDEDNISWNVGLNYKTPGNTLLYTRIAKGYKAGSFPTNQIASYTGYAPVKQESVLAYEAGVKAPLFDRRLEISAAAFYYDYKDKQLGGRKPDPVFVTLAALVQVPKSTVKGIEGQLTLRPIDGLTVSGGATYIETKIKEFVGFDGAGASADFAGQRFPYAPKFTLTADAEYRFDVNDATEAYLGGSVTHNSATSASLQNRTTDVLGEDARFDVDGYTLLDLRAGASFNDGKIDVSVFGRNITNKYYWSNVQDSIVTIVRYTGRPATYGVQVAWRY